MVQNPFGEGLSVTLSSETSDFTSGIDGAIGKLGDLKKVVGTAGALLGGLAAGGLAKSASAAADFEEAMVGVEKVTSPETAAEMEEKIKDLASTMPVAQEELAGIAEQAGRLGVEGTDALESYTSTVAQMATATDLTSEEAADSFARIGTLMDIPIEQSSNLGSAVNELSNTMGTSASEITDVMTRAGGSLNQLGVGKEQALSLAGAMNEVSPSSRLAAGGMKRMAESMMDPKNVGAFAEVLGVTEEEFKRMRDEEPGDTLLKVAEATSESKDAADVLKGELGKAGQEFQTLGQNTESAREATETATKAWEENVSMQEEAETAASTFNSQLDIAKNRLQNVAITIGEQLLPPLTDLLGYVSRGVERFSKLNEKTDGMLGTMSLVAGVVGGFGVALAALVGGPITLAIGAVALLAAAWAMGWEDIKVAVSEGVERVTELLGSVMDWLKENGPGIAERALEIFETMLTDIAAWVKENGPGLVGEAFEAVGKAIRLVAIDLYNAITGNDDSVIKSLLKDAASWVIENGPGILKSAFQLAIDAVIAAFKGLYEGLIGGSLIPELFSDIADYIMNDAASDLADAALQAADDAANAFIDTFNEVMPSEIPIPEVTIGGGTIPNPLPGGDDFELGTATLGGGDWDMPQLASGGFIEEGGLAQLHAGERVVPAAQVSDRGEQTIKVEQNPRTANEVQKLREDLMAQAQSGGGDVTLKIGRREFGELITDIQNEQASTWVTR